MANSILDGFNVPGSTATTKPQTSAVPDMRDFVDPGQVRNRIFDNVLKAASAMEPVSNVRHRLELSNVGYADNNDYTLAQQKAAILRGESLHRRLRGTWRLVNTADNGVLDERQVTLAQVPYMTDRGTFIINGNEYSLSNQMRLRPGIFTRIKENGEVESHVNIMPGKGLSHRYFLDPVTGVFKINIGQSKVPLLPVLRALGTTDDELRKTWGEGLYAANQKKDDPVVIDKLYSRLVRRGGASNIDEKRKALADALNKMELDPEVTKRTIGRDFPTLSKDAILATTQKLLAVSKGEAEPDDRDNLAFQTFLGPEDLIAERIGKDKSLIRQALWKAFTKNNLQHIQPGLFTKQLYHAILKSGLGQALEEVNSSDIFDQQSRVSRLGEGGIPCFSDKTYLLTRRGWLKWPHVTDNDEVAVNVDGEMRFEKPKAIYRNHYSGPMVLANTKTFTFCVTPNHRLYVQDLNSNEWKFITADEAINQDLQYLVTNNDGTIASNVIVNHDLGNYLSAYSYVDYDGMVYCAEVTGGLLLTMYKGKPFWSGNSIDAVPDECFDKDTEVFTSEGWKFWHEVDKNTKFACRINERIEYRKAVRLIKKKYKGEMYGIRTRCINHLVTPNHRIWCRKYRSTSSIKRCGLTKFEFQLAKDVHRKPRQFLLTSLPFVGDDSITEFELPLVDGARKTYKFPIDDWAELVGWYVSEGSIDSYALRERKKYHITISQNIGANTDKVDRIKKLLNKVGIQASYQGHNFVFVSKQIGKYFETLGTGCINKHLPECVFNWPISARKRLLESLMLGDGHEVDNGITKYFSVSPVLTEQVVRLQTTLGLPARPRKPYDRKDHDDWNTSHSCGSLTSDYQGVTDARMYDRCYYTKHYDDYVYCAEVPGELLLVRRQGFVPMWSGNSRAVQPSHFGFVDPIRTPESFRVGIDSRIAYSAKKGADGRVYAPFVDVKNGQTVYKSPQEVADLVVAFPGEMKKNKPVVAAMVGGKTKFVPRNTVHVELPDMEKAFSPLANMVPMKSAVKGQRVAMGSRFIAQALPVRDAESPLVQSATPDDQNTSFEELYGKYMGAVKADQPGKVMKVTPDFITVKHDDGTTKDYQLYNSFPYNRKSVTGDTEITVKINKGKIWRGPIKDYKFTTGDKVLSIDPNSCRSAWLPINGYIKHKNDKQLFVVKTASGRSVKITEDHSLVTLDEHGELVPIYPHECEINKTKLPVAGFNFVKSRQPSLLDYEYGLVAGLYLSEGHCPDGTNSIAIATAVKKRANKIIELLSRVSTSGHKPFYCSGNVILTDADLRKWLLSNFGHMAHGKRVPVEYLNRSLEFKIGLIQGYMAGDGCLWSDRQNAIQLEFVSVSQELRNNLVDVLSSLGIFCSLFDAPRAHINDNWRDGYGARIISGHIRKLDKWFFYADRQKKLNKLLAPKYRASKFEQVPVINKTARRLVCVGFNDVSKATYKAGYKGSVSKHLLEGCDTIFGKWATSDVMWDTVESIEAVPHEQWVYDLEVAKSNVFAVNNGLVVHNTFIHNTPLVNIGDRINPNQLLAKSNYTDETGATALGKNARVAYIPFRGLNYEDAYVVSEGFAKRMSSEHMYQHDHQWMPTMKQGKKTFVSVFPGKFDRQILDKLDDDGVIHPGQTVEYGEPLVLAVQEREPSFSQIHRGRGRSYSDKTVLWEHHSPGIITDVAKTKKGVTVAVKAYSPMQQGDKIAGRYGDKGVLAAIIPDDEMPHGEDGQPYEVLANPLGIISRCYDDNTEFLTDNGWRLGKHVNENDLLMCFDPNTHEVELMRQLSPMYSAKYKGEMIKYHSKAADFCVTPNHKMWARCDYTGSEWHETTAERIYGHRWWVPTVGRNIMPGEDKAFILPHIEYKSKDTQSDKSDIFIDAGDFAEFMGWYQSEGHYVYNERVREYKVFISQDERANPDKCKRIESLLNKLPFKWFYKHSTQQFVINSKRLASYCKQFGKCYEKFIPRWVFESSAATRDRFLESVWGGDGSFGPTNTGVVKGISLTSEYLIDDIQELLFYQGYASTKRKIKVRPGNRPMWRIGVMLVKTDRQLTKYNWSKKRYNGKIYCPSVPTGYVVTRRNGRLLCAGNTNPAQMVEAALGKIAAVTGKRYRVADFKDIDDLTQYAMDELAKHGMSDTETLTDPKTGHQIPGVFTGNRFIMKLHHTSECFDDQTEVLTERGWVAWPKVTKEDKLATSDGDKLFFEKPIKLFKSRHRGELYCFSGRYIDYAVTENHRLYVRSPYANSSFTFKSAKEMHGRRFCVKQFGFNPHDDRRKKYFKLGKHKIKWADYAELVGWWATEGYARVTPRRAYVMIYQSKEANPEYFDRIELLLNRLPFKWHYYKVEGKFCGFGISSRELATHLKGYGSHSYNKRLPRYILNAPLKARHMAYEAMMSGDGSGQETDTGLSLDYTTTSQGLADDFQELCISLGSGTVVRMAKARKTKPPRAKKAKYYRPVWECGVALVRDIAQVDGDRNKDGFYIKQYDGMVYCAEMRTGLLYVRRNGKPMLSGNSKGQGRGMGAYTSEQTPAKGGPEGCFAASQYVMTIDGPMRIGTICENQLGVYVRTYDEKTDNWTYRPVVDWFIRRANVNDLRQVYTTDGRCMYVTTNHEVYLAEGGKTTVDKLKEGDHLVTWGPVPTEHQLQMMYGSLLGDASINDCSYSAEHSIEQLEYVDWQQSVLAGLGATTYDRKKRKKPNVIRGQIVKSKPSRIVYVAQRYLTDNFKKECYSGPDNSKKVTKQWLDKVGGLGVAMWVIDDGSITNRAKKAGQISRTGNIATMGFTDEDQQILAEWLKERYGSHCAVTTNGQINLSADMCEDLIEEVAKWVPWQVIPKGKKFVRKQVRKLQETNPPIKLNIKCKLGKIPLRIKKITPYKVYKNKNEINVYDMTVADTHCYCAGHLLVSNSKKISLMDDNALLSHGATEVLRDAKVVRGQRNDNYWQAFMSGFKPPEPQIPFVYRKFVAGLQASGINPVRKGGQVHIMALTNKDVDKLAGNRYLTNADTVDWKEGLKPIRGGLFDPALTGGHGTESRWAAIKLTEPMPNPVFEEPIRRLLGLTQKQFEDVISGRKGLSRGGKLYDLGSEHELFGYGSGPEAVSKALKSINVDDAIREAQQQIDSGKKTARDVAVRKMGYLKSAKELGIHPSDWMMDKVPVLPPAFRPVSVLSTTKTQMVADANYLYKELFDANQNLQQLKQQVDDVSDERLTLYNAFKAVVGLGDPTHPKNQGKVKGILRSIFGSSPKLGTVQYKLLGSTVDLVGRAVIAPNPDLDMDHVGLPESRAWAVYTPFIVRRLVRRGVPRLQAAHAVKERLPLAREALLQEMEDRPVIINRAPVLHRYGIMAAWPILTKGDTLQLSPIVTKGFGADFDGDAMQYHVPATDEAKDEAVNNMLPSRNLLSVSNFKVHYLPSQEYQGGLYSASVKRDNNKRPRIFDSTKSVLEALNRGEINIDHPVEVIKH